MNDPSYYYEDYSYTEVSSPRENDIICYFDDNGTPNDTSDDLNIHSGIVIGLLLGTSNNLCGNSDKVLVRSKWGQAGLYEHNGYECPYTVYKPGASRVADYVKYYRKHSYIYQRYNSLKHYHTCTECGFSVIENHTYFFAQKDDNHHYSQCEGCMFSFVQEHNFCYEIVSSTEHVSICDDCGYVGLQPHTWNSSHTECTSCGFN